jgi:NAD(P)-dependent dehydrogenase (short-subunit alcohol dehydrogenase family)
MSSKKIVITGATRGIGRALAETWIAQGHTVVGCGRSADLVKHFSQKYPGPHRFDTLDVSDPVAVATWCQTVLDHLGPPDLLINNAAIIGENRPLWEVPTEQFSQVVDVNIKGVFYVIKGLVPAMIEADHGVIVNLSSGWGRSTSPASPRKWSISSPSTQ